MKLLSPFARLLSLVFDIKFLLPQAFREDVSRMAKAVQAGTLENNLQKLTNLSK